MKAHFSNAAYGVLDYAAYPVAMLVAAPTLLHHLGAAQYGVWIVCIAAVSTGGIIASGFGDANIQYVATQRERGNLPAVEQAVRSMLAINLLLGAVMAAIGFAVAPTLSRHVVGGDGGLYEASLWSLRIASVSMLVRAVESVCISTQRAFERYGAAVRISILVRVLTIFLAAVTTWSRFGVASIMVSTLVLMMAGTAVQLIQLKRLAGASSLLPTFDHEACAALFGFGVFSWLQAVSGVIFSQADRLILGASVGAASLTSYALCVQMAQPIYGITAAGLHFLFPYLAGRKEAEHTEHLRKAIAVSMAVNLVFVLVAGGAELSLGQAFLRKWVGNDIASASVPVLAPVVWSFSLLGLAVTGYYAMLAFRRVHLVTALNLAGGAAMLLLTVWLLPRMGVRGVAVARLVYGAVALGVYLPLMRIVFFELRSSQGLVGTSPVCEER
jgi:O-antigen/teichoic acid export membrane protein